jgi:hypothetical protein
MSEELRDLSPLPASVQRLLEAERQRPGPTPDAQERMLGRLAVALGLPGGGLGGPSDPGGSPGAPASSSSAPGLSASAVGLAGGAAATVAGSGATSVVAAFLKPAVAVAFAVGAIVGSSTIHVLHRPAASTTAVEARHTGEVRRTGERGATDPSARPGLSPRPIPISVSTPSASRPRAASASPASRPRRGAPPPDPAAGASDSLGAERALIERARSALARARPGDALAALGQHRKNHAAGQLREEREALTVIALASQGENEKASDAADRFRRKHPQSLLLPAVEAALKASTPLQAGDREKPKHLP